MVRVTISFADSMIWAGKASIFLISLWEMLVCECSEQTFGWQNMSAVTIMIDRLNILLTILS